MQPPRFARYNFLFSIVYRFLKELPSRHLPFDPISYIHQKGWKLITYTEYINKKGLDPESKPPMPGFTLYKKGKYKIFYDETQGNRRAMFTLGHEIAHILLNHFNEFDKASFSRGGFSNSEYKVLETECDVFSKNILAPLHLVLPLHLDSLGIYTLFNVSMDAAQIRFTTRNLDTQYLSPTKLLELQDHHVAFLNSCKRLNKCHTCGNLFLIGGTYCPICGAQINLPVPIKKEGFSMQYKEYATNKWFRLLKCTKCGNEVFGDTDNYCKICGTAVRNKCSHYVDDYGNGCDTLLPGNARYCTQCGEKSIFLVKDILTSWEQERDKIQQQPTPVEIRELDDLLSAKDDDDLPF